MPAAAATPLLLAHALSLLVARPHAARELAAKLARVCARRRTSKLVAVREAYAGVDCAACVATVLGDLRARGLVDDAAYATWHIGQRMRGRPRSAVQLAAELAGKGVARGEAAAAVTAGGYDEVEAAVAALRRRRPAPPARAAATLRYAGFPHAAVAAATARLAAERARISDAVSDGDEVHSDAASAGPLPPGGRPLHLS